LVVSATGIAAAGSSPFGASTTTSGSAATDPTTPTDPGTTGTTDPTDPGTTDPTTTDPTTTGPTLPVDPNLPLITFTLPQASAHLRYERTRLRRREWHRHAVSAVLTEARKQSGKPYVYGAAGPRSFDCSGLVRFVFGHAIGKWLPHNAAAQYSVIQHIRRRDLKPGDLVFQESGGYPFHVGIYAGHDKWWHAPHTGAVVHKQTIYRGHLFYGRVLTSRLARSRTRR
jgi:cell wall-associated NlpC family hydrolase